MSEYYSKRELEDFLNCCKKILEELIDYLSSSGENIPLPDKVKDVNFDFKIPEEGISLCKLEEIFFKKILPLTMPVTSKRYLGMMNPVPNLGAVMGEFLKASINQNCSLYKQSPIGTLLEEIVIKWFGNFAGYRGNFFGTIVSGGSVGNLTGLKVARNEKYKDMRDKGLFGKKRLRYYVSSERHYSIDRAIDILGIGLENLVTIETDRDFKIDTEKLEAKIEEDVKNGFLPAAIIGIAGTTNTGSIDPLSRLSEIAKKHGCWFHVDAAYGGAALLVDELRDKFSGIEEADSVVIDPHKWFFIPFESGIVLFKERKKLKDNFSFRHNYYVIPDPDFSENTNFFEYSIQGSRGFRALKIWMGLSYFGVERYKNLIKKGILFSKRLALKLRKYDEIEILCDPELSILTFTYRDKDMYKLYEKVERDSKYWFSLTRINGKLAFRINFENFRFGEDDLSDLENYLISLIKK